MSILLQISIKNTEININIASPVYTDMKKFKTNPAILFFIMDNHINIDITSNIEMDINININIASDVNININIDIYFNSNINNNIMINIDINIYKEF